MSAATDWDRPVATAAAILRRLIYPIFIAVKGGSYECVNSIKLFLKEKKNMASSSRAMASFMDR